MEERTVNEDAPVNFPFRAGKDVLPGKGEWYKRNNVFFRNQVGEYSDLYDTCTKVSEKREIARLVVEAVYSNGGRFLDAEGNDIGFKRSMDKAMKALKDRRHIKSRKLVTKPISHSAQAIKKRVQEGRRHPKAAPKQPPKDPLDVDDAGLALLLLRNAKEKASSQKSPLREEPRLPLNKRKHRPDGGVLPLSLAVKNALKAERGGARLSREVTDDRFEEPQRRGSQRSFASYSGSETTSTRSPSPPAQTPASQILASAKAAAAKKATETNDKSKEGADGNPVLWQSVIVSRENPQASLADMLVNAKQRLDALSSIQQAVSAPICLIYPPNPALALQAQLSAQQQVALAQIPLGVGGQVQLARVPLKQELFQGFPRPAARSGAL